MESNRVALREQLHHPHYSWPESLVFLPAETCEAGENVHVIDERGEARPAQWASRAGKRVLALVTGLSCGEEKVFSVCPGAAEGTQTLECAADGESVRVRNGRLTLTVFRGADEALFSLGDASSAVRATARLNRRPESRKVEVLAAGGVFAEVRVEAAYAAGEKYELTIRLALGMEFAELHERMSGFDASARAALEVTFEGFFPQYRLNHYRGCEPIDQYLGEDGRIPLMVAPFDSWVSWWMDKSISFPDEAINRSAGVFVTRAEEWDDGEYALWRSSKTLAVRFEYRAERLRFVYPLASGCRATALTIFSNDLEESLGGGSHSDGLYSQDKRSPIRAYYAERLWFFHEFIRLDKVKDWTLRWTEDRAAYPRFFREDMIPPEGTKLWYLGECKTGITPKQVEKVVYELSDSMNQMIRTGPVSNREFYDWAVMFDMAIPHMTDEQFDDLKAAFAFCAYAFSDEGYMPIRNMLAGHPNFLADARGAAAVASALFPAHPAAKAWKDEFELSAARNLKYHTRPDVKAWECLGGRETENLGCYVFAMLRPYNCAQLLLHGTYGDRVMLYPALTRLFRYLLGTLSAPVDGVRRFPSLGAHSDVRRADMFELAQWGDALCCYAPILAENLWYLGRRDGAAFENSHPLYRALADARWLNARGTRPELKSAKYTGYGFVMRANVYEPDEMTVELIQIDEGPNYRWGRAGDGGCGSLCYYAEGRQYGGQRREDVGDWNKGAVQSCCNFGVLMDHEFVSVGRNDLTEPLYDFGFAQYARVNAGERAKAFYDHRGVIMSGNDYIVVLDAVRDLRVHGRFSWFNAADERMPGIVQLRPGAAGVDSDGGIPVDMPALSPDGAYRGRYYEGDGDFLTLVSHRPLNSDRGVYTTARDWGVLVELQGRTDYVFQRAAKIRYDDRDGVGFTGYAGMARVYGDARAEAALFDGSDIRVCGVAVHCEQTARSKAGVGFSVAGGRVTGAVQTREPVEVTLSLDSAARGRRLYVDGLEIARAEEKGALRFIAPAGRTRWELTAGEAEPAVPQMLRAVTGSRRVELCWRSTPPAKRYRVEVSADGGKRWRVAAETEAPRCALESLENDVKIHVRVRGLNGAAQGAPCWEYPVYVTAQTPWQAEGLRVWKDGDGYLISWGEQLGASGYRLYRKLEGETAYKLIYEGEETRHEDAPGARFAAYAVAVVNGNGEGPRSLPRGTRENGLEAWDPRPTESFRRYAASHEYGYQGFDSRASYESAVLAPYPD